LREYFRSLGRKKLITHKKKFKLISEMLNGIKEIKLLDAAGVFLEKFANTAFEYASVQFKAKSISTLPKLFIELSLLISLITIILVNLLVTNKSFISIVTYLSVYAVAAYKLLPSIQIIFNQNVSLGYNIPLLDDLYNDYKNLMNNDFRKIKHNEILIKDFIELQNVNFNYPESKNNTLKNIEAVFNTNKSIAIVGPSGSGKSTLVEILIGLLKVKKGNVIIDNKKVKLDQYNSWIKNFSVVPQTVYILDDTVISNIAFGLEPKFVSFERVKLACRIACLEDLIEDQLPEKYNTILGERGIKLSGGQKQRIAIARAIYRDTKFIIFDEATSELDSQTEKIIISNIKEFKKVGIIAIAHRISTIKDFDEILFIKNGSIVKKGNYKELIEFEDFKKLI